jgi:hypothetical protein
MNKYFQLKLKNKYIWEKMFLVNCLQLKTDITETRAVNVLSELSTIKDGHYRNKSSECFEWTVYY